MSKMFNAIVATACGWYHETIAAPDRESSKMYANIGAPLITLAAVVLPLLNDDPAMATLGGALSVVTFYETGKGWHKTGQDLSGNKPSGPA